MVFCGIKVKELIDITENIIKGKDYSKIYKKSIEDSKKYSYSEFKSEIIKLL